jgi:hypothetical protein
MSLEHSAAQLAHMWSAHYEVLATGDALHLQNIVAAAHVCCNDCLPHGAVPAAACMCACVLMGL